MKEAGGGSVRTYTSYDDAHGSIEEGLEYLDTFDVVAGHNILHYDVPVLELMYGWTPKATVRDTMVMSKMGYTALYEKDKRVAWRNNPDFPRSMTGWHGLRAWGYRLGIHKGHVNDTEDYSICDEQMLIYCAQDVLVNEKLWFVLAKRLGGIPDAVQIEHEFVVALRDMTNAGCYINREAADKLLNELEDQRAALLKELLALFPARTLPALNEEREPENLYWNPKQLKTKERVIPFNPGSAIQVAWNLVKKYGWRPKKFTNEKKTRPKLTAEILNSLPYPEAKKLARYAMLSKRIGSLAGDSGYVTLLDDEGRLHGKVDHCGAVTHRCTHSKPNMGNPTSVKVEYGPEIRRLFSVPSGYRMVGCDASGLELRMLGNRLAFFDGGEYAREVVSGDIHTKNQEAAGLATRDLAKRFIYALLYGAGNAKIGSIIVPDGEVWNEARLKREGGALKKKFFEAIPAVKALIKSLKDGFRPGQEITGLDGRVAENRSAHQALNTQLQMDGAVVIKWATVLAHREFKKRGWVGGKDGDVQMVLHVHDEYQFQARTEIADDVGRIAARAITEAGVLLSVACRLDGEYAVGDSWADTH